MLKSIYKDIKENRLFYLIIQIYYNTMVLFYLQIETQIVSREYKINF